MKYLVALFLLPALAFGQSTGQSIDSIWAPPKYTATASVQALRTDAITGAFVPISGQVKPLGVIKLGQSPITTVFPGQKSAPMTISGVRLTVLAKGLSWISKSVVDISITPIVAQAGKSVAVRYDAPLLAMGYLQTAVGVTAIDPPPGPGPVVIGPIPPPVVPPTPIPTGISPPDSSIPPLPELVTSDGIRWTFIAPTPFRAGVNVILNSYPDMTRMYIRSDGQVCMDGSAHGFLCWNGTNWGG